MSIETLNQTQSQDVPSIFEIDYNLTLNCVVSDTHSELSYLYWLRYRVAKLMISFYIDWEK